MVVQSVVEIANFTGGALVLLGGGDVAGLVVQRSTPKINNTLLVTSNSTFAKNRVMSTGLWSGNSSA